MSLVQFVPNFVTITQGCAVTKVAAAHIVWAAWGHTGASTGVSSALSACVGW